MVTTRQSRKSIDAKQEDDAASNGAVKSTPRDKSTTPSPSKRSSSQKKHKKDDLKSKNTGFGPSIVINDATSKQNKKIVFDDAFEEVANEGQLQETAEQVNKDEGKEADNVEVSFSKGDEDDDDEVEEVKGSAAREGILHQLESEEKGALKAKKKKKRKDRKKAVPDDADDDFNDDFFAQLETAKAEEQSKKRSESRKKKKGKHTTFVFGESSTKGGAGTNPSVPRKVGHNIQVMVLPDQDETFADDAITAVPTTAMSEDALLYSRRCLQDGSDGGGQKRKRNAPNLPDTSWKRSRKMSLVMTAKSRFNRRGGRGLPAANFASKSNR